MSLLLYTKDKQDFILKNNIKLNRIQMNLTQEELGDLIQVTRQSIAAIEKGTIPSLVVAAKIACVFDKDISDIFYLEEKGCKNEKIHRFFDQIRSTTED